MYVSGGPEPLHLTDPRCTSQFCTLVRGPLPVAALPNTAPANAARARRTAIGAIDSGAMAMSKRGIEVPLRMLPVLVLASALLYATAADAAASLSPPGTVVVVAAAQGGLMNETGPINPHAYRPNELVVRCLPKGNNTPMRRGCTAIDLPNTNRMLDLRAGAKLDL